MSLKCSYVAIFWNDFFWPGERKSLVKAFIYQTQLYYNIIMDLSTQANTIR